VDFNVVLNQLEEFDDSSFDRVFREAIANLCEGWEVDFVGVSAMFSSAYEASIDLLQISRSMFPNAMILVGGNLPTSLWREYLEESQVIDALCYGEGELPLKELFSSDRPVDYLKASSSWVTSDDLVADEKTLSHNFIVDLDEIPPVDYDILDIAGYKTNPTVSRYAVAHSYELDSAASRITLERAIGKSMVTQEISSEDIPPIPIMTSRGCPFKCTFCASHAAHGRDMRYFSIDRVKKDLQLLVDKYGSKGVVVQDDHFMGGKRRPYEVVSAIGEYQLQMFFQNALAIYALDREFLERLKANNVNELVLPVESGSMRVLRDLMRKPLKLSVIPRVVKDCREIGIYTDCNIIIGMPGEKIEDIAEARTFLKTLYADWFRVFVASPIPGSEMHQQVVDLNAYEVPPIKANYKRAVIKTEFLTPEQIHFYTYLMNLELNFLYNSNLRLGNYQVAAEAFQSVLNVKSDHLYAVLGLALVSVLTNDTEAAAEYYKRACDIADKDSYWRPFSDDLGIDLNNLSIELFLKQIQRRWDDISSKSESIESIAI